MIHPGLHHTDDFPQIESFCPCESAVYRVDVSHVCVGPQIGMNPKPLLGLLPELKYRQIPTQTDSGSPRSNRDCFFCVFFSVTHKIGLFSSKIEAIPMPEKDDVGRCHCRCRHYCCYCCRHRRPPRQLRRHCLLFIIVSYSLLAVSSSIPFVSLLRRRHRSQR